MRTKVAEDEMMRTGFLIHELRNALSCVYAAHAAVRRAAGSSALLETNLHRMKSILDRASVEVRRRQEPRAQLRRMPLIELVREVEAEVGTEARRKGVSLSVRVEHGLMVNADGEYLVSAVFNLVQNAVKFTRPGGAVSVRGREKDGFVALEVEDQCGGLPCGRIGELFEPFTQFGADRTGLGLGLTISRRAVALNNGVLSVRDIPGRGCAFLITLPSAREPAFLSGCHGEFIRN